VLLVLIALIVYVGSQHQPRQQIVPIQPASTYFTISDPAAVFKSVGSNTNASILRSVLLTTIGFSFTPIGGPATDLTIFMQGMSDPTQTAWNNTIPKGETILLDNINLPNPITSIRQSDGTFAFNVTFNCAEATGVIVIHFKSDELVGT
jgi:hypothetical protein